MAEGLKRFNQGKNELPLEGKTVGELIELQRKWVEKQKTAEADQAASLADFRKLIEEAKANEGAIAAELRKSITLTVYEKGFLPTDVEARRFQAYLTYSVAYQNTSPKDIRAFQGTVVFQDLFGDKVMQIQLKITDPVKAGEKAVWKGTSHYNEFDQENIRLRNTVLKNLRIVWVPEKIIFVDGTTIPKEGQTK